MQLIFQAKHKSTNYSAAQSSAHVYRFGMGCVFVPSHFFYWDKGGCSQKKKLCFIVSYVEFCAYFPLGFSASPCSGDLGCMKSFPAFHVGSLNLWM